MPQSLAKKGDMYFIYDGQCPLCLNASRLYKLRQTVGNLHVIDARTEHDNLHLKEVNKRGINLDKGMVVVFNDQYYHGQDALHVMAMLGSNNGFFNKINSMFFKSKLLCRICYPFMKMARNIAIFIKGAGWINNLKNKS